MKPGLRVLISGFCGLLLLAGCVSTPNPPSAPTARPPSPTPTEVKVFPTPSVPGDLAAWGDLRLKMLSAEIADRFINRFGSERVPAAGQKFLWVQVRLENVGKNEIAMPAGEHFSVLYADSEFKPTYGHRQDYPDYTSLTSPLFPGQTVDAWLRFDIPETARLAELRFVFLPESAQVGVRPVSPSYPWGGEHPIFVWRCEQ